METLERLVGWVTGGYEVEGVAGAIARRGAGTEGESEKGEGEAGGEALEARFHRYY